VGIGLAFASLANLIVESVPRDQTGVATGMNTIVRTIGGAIGAQIAVSILASHTLASGYPTESGYTITFAVCLLVMVAAVGASLLVPARRAAEAEAPHVVPVPEPVPAVE
jgi:sugar phosphate permease